jgi:hypothetical protein
LDNSIQQSILEKYLNGYIITRKSAFDRNFGATLNGVMVFVNVLVIQLADSLTQPQAIPNGSISGIKLSLPALN